MKKIGILITFALIFAAGYGQNTIDKRVAIIRNWIIYQGDTLTKPYINGDTLFTEQGAAKDTLVVSGAIVSISGDTLFVDGDTLVISGVNYWDAAGDTLTTDYNVVIDSSFRMQYHRWKMGYTHDLADENIDTNTVISYITDTDNLTYMGVVHQHSDPYIDNLIGAKAGDSAAYIQQSPGYIEIYTSDADKTTSAKMYTDSLVHTSGNHVFHSDLADTPTVILIDSLQENTGISYDNDLVVMRNCTNDQLNEVPLVIFKNNLGLGTTYDDQITLTADLKANAYNISNIDTAEVANLVMTTPYAWMDQFRQQPFYFTELWGAAVAYTSPWAGSAVNSGTYGSVATTGTEHPGYVKFTSSTTNNSGYYMACTSSGLGGIAGGERTTFIVNWIQFDSTTTRLGFHDAATYSDAVDGVYFEVSAAGVATGKASNNSTRTSTATTYSLSLATWYRFVIMATSSSRIDYYIYNEAGTLLWTDEVESNIPTARAFGNLITCTKETSGTGGAKDLIYVDYIDMYLGTLTR